MALTFHLHLSSMKLVIVPKVDHDLSYFRVYTNFPFSRRSSPILLFLEKFIYSVTFTHGPLQVSGSLLCSRDTLELWTYHLPLPVGLALPRPPLCPGKLTHVVCISGSLVLQLLVRLFQREAPAEGLENKSETTVRMYSSLAPSLPGWHRLAASASQVLFLSGGVLAKQFSFWYS